MINKVNKEKLLRKDREIEFLNEKLKELTGKIKYLTKDKNNAK